MNPTALVTGGSKALGFAIASKLCENGYDVAISGVSQKSLVTEALDKLSSAGTKVIYCQGDIGYEKDRGRIVSKLKNDFGRLNLLVNNTEIGPIEKMDPLKASQENFDRLMRINLKGPYFLTQDLTNWMVEQKQKQDSFEATVINIGSILATVVSCNHGDYCISKAGLAMHNKVWAVRLAKYGIPVYEIRPGVTKTEMSSTVIDTHDTLIGEELPGNVAKTVLSLARGDFSYSTGEVILIDNGLKMSRL